MTQRASFPWDPEPQPAALAAPTFKTEPASSTSNTPKIPTPTSATFPNSMNTQHNIPTNVPIKLEPTYDVNLHRDIPITSPYSTGINAQQSAIQRAQHLAYAQFGNQATGSIAAMQAAQMGLPQMPQQQQQQQSQQQRPQGTAPQQRPQQSNGTPVIKQEAQDSLGFSQTDGAGEAPHASSSNGTFRQQAADMALRLEGGGLLLPLDERRQPSRKALKIRARNTAHQSTAGPSPYDGVDDEADEDAINSDLDDSEDEALEGNIEADFQGDVILCLYDKVQRVKNKWKCTLKDGVVTVDGKE